MGGERLVDERGQKSGDAVIEGGVGVYCPECGYDLRGTAGNVCGECGTVVDRAKATVSVIAWENRKVTRWWRAYWRTVWAVTIRPGSLVRAVSGEVSLAAASRFRWVTVVFATVAIWGVMGAVGLIGAERVWAMIMGPNWSVVPPMGMGVGRDVDLMFPLGAAVRSLVVYPLCAMLMAIGLSGVQTYFFHPATVPVERQNRAVALSYYACGPLAWAFVPGGLGCIFLVLRAVAGGGWTGDAVLALVGMAATALAILLAMLRAVLAMQRAVDAGEGRKIWVAVAVAGCWVLAGVVTMGALPWAVGLAVLMGVSW